MAVCERGHLCPLLKVSGAEQFLISEVLLLQSLKYIFSFSFGLYLQNKSVELYPRGEQEKKLLFFLENLATGP